VTFPVCSESRKSPVGVASRRSGARLLAAGWEPGAGEAHGGVGTGVAVAVMDFGLVEAPQARANTFTPMMSTKNRMFIKDCSVL
jgi:hypothetical protein